jgi:hypothetical protein
MQASQLRPTRTPAGRRRFVAFLALSLLAGCANGDFKQVKPYLVRDDIHDWVGPAAVGPHVAHSDFVLTDDERQLRDLAYPLIQPPYDRHQWYQIIGEYGGFNSELNRSFDHTLYATHLFGDRYRSPSARYSRLTDDIRNDETRLPQFFETATRVVDIDEKRRKSMDYIRSLSRPERDQALLRINENRAIIGWVIDSLNRRIQSYQFALGRLVVMTPSQQAVETERVLDRLKAAVAYYSQNPAPSWGQGKSLASVR